MPLGQAFCPRSILRFHDQSLAIKEFKLKVELYKLVDNLKDVDIWLKLACECGVEVINYSLDVLVGQDQYHVLPMCVIEAKSIKKLVLKGYIKIDPTFMNHSIKFTSLRVLSLCSDDGTMEKKKSLSISGLQKLKRVDTFGIQDVSIDSGSLETLCYHCPINFNAPLKIDFDRCGNLKELWMWSVNERIDISCVRLKVLELSHCSNLKEINIDAPNLLSCGYKGSGASLPTICFLRNSSRPEVNIQVDYVDLCNLREFMQNINPNNVLTSLALSISNSSNVVSMN
ncbi:FBD-associated F-box protein [Trifolium pratense]|uniref:FBD-associated F-box protein n=1 Tax=Trifolium pratense TaxID=57577 RepID=A0A2K3M3E5_TRIPR|nr:FBD-associated F-box protein [Trifolium pratense]